MTRMISKSRLFSAAAAGAAPSAPSQTTHKLSITTRCPLISQLSRDRAIRGTPNTGYQVGATIVDMDGVRQGRPSR